MGRPVEPFEQRLERHRVDRGDGCCSWGQWRQKIKFRGKVMSVARALWLHFRPDEVIPRDMWVVHSCGHSWCVNPKHLKLGLRGCDAWGERKPITNEARLYRRW